MPPAPEDRGRTEIPHGDGDGDGAPEGPSPGPAPEAGGEAIADMGKAIHELEAEERAAGGDGDGRRPEHAGHEGEEGRGDPVRGFLDSQRGRMAVLSGAGVLALGLGWLLLTGPDGDPPAPGTAGGRPPSTADSAGESAAAPGAGGSLTVEEVVLDAPELTFRDDPIDFGEPGAGRPALATATLVHGRGHRGALAVDRPRIEGTGTLPEVVRSPGDCLDGPQSPGDAGVWCELGLRWSPGPGESLAATLTLRYAPWDDSLEALPGASEAVAVIERPWEPVEVSVRLAGGPEERAAPPEPARLRVEVPGAAPGGSPRLDFGPGVRVGRESSVRAELAIEGGPAAVESVRLAGLPPETLQAMRLEAQGCVRAYVPGGGTGRDWCEVSLAWTPAAPGGLPAGAELVVTWSRSPDGGPPDRLRASVPVLGEARTPPPPLSASPPAAAVREASQSLAGPHGEAVLSLRAGDDPVSVLPGRLAIEEATPSGPLAPPSTTSDCPVEIPLEPGGACEVRVVWPAPPGARGHASLEIPWSAAGAAGSLQVPVTLETPVSRAPAGDPRETLVRRLREEIGGRRALPALQEGIGVVTTFDSIGARLRSIEEARAAAGARRAGPGAPFHAVDEDWSSLSVDPGEGLSSRPVRMAATVLQGTPIRAVIARTFNAKLETPVMAIVEVDVHSAHGRNVVIPRGSRIFGWTYGPQDGEAGLNGGASHMLTARQGKIDIRWSRLTRPDGTAFRVDGRLSTADLMGNPGVAGHIDLRELERYAQILSSRGFGAAAALLIDTDRNLVTTQRSDDQGRAVQETRETLSPRRQALQELQAGLAEIAAEMSALHVPPPTITVPGGTRIVLQPTVDLWLRKGAQPPASGRGEPSGGLPEDLGPEGPGGQEPPPPAEGPGGGPRDAQAPDAPVPQRRTRRPLSPQEMQALSERSGAGGGEISRHGLDRTGLEGTVVGDTLHGAARSLGDSGGGPARGGPGAGSWSDSGRDAGGGWDGVGTDDPGGPWESGPWEPVQ